MTEEEEEVTLPGVPVSAVARPRTIPSVKRAAGVLDSLTVTTTSEPTWTIAGAPVYSGAQNTSGIYLSQAPTHAESFDAQSLMSMSSGSIDVPDDELLMTRPKSMGGKRVKRGG